jgi:hypothetical protein
LTREVYQAGSHVDPRNFGRRICRFNCGNLNRGKLIAIDAEPLEMAVQPFGHGAALPSRGAGNLPAQLGGKAFDRPSVKRIA